MSRMETNALAAVINSTEAGGYTLPVDILDAWRTYERIKAVEVDIPIDGDPDAAAARLVSAAAAGEPVDATAQARLLDDLTAARHVADQARLLVTRAQEQAGENATLLASDAVDRIITDHLAPAYAALLAEAREVAAILAGHSLDPHALLTAPAKVRNAYLQLPALTSRRAAILDARRRLNTMGHRKPQNDMAELFSSFARPMTFFPTWRPPACVPKLPFPEGAQETLLWLATDPTALAAEPWLPTMAQQDAAWWAQFGEAQEMRRQAHRNGVAVGARGN